MRVRRCSGDTGGKMCFIIQAIWNWWMLLQYQSDKCDRFFIKVRTYVTRFFWQVIGAYRYIQVTHVICDWWKGCCNIHVTNVRGSYEGDTCDGFYFSLIDIFRWPITCDMWLMRWCCNIHETSVTGFIWQVGWCGASIIRWWFYMEVTYVTGFIWQLIGAYK